MRDGEKNRKKCSIKKYKNMTVGKKGKTRKIKTDKKSMYKIIWEKKKREKKRSTVKTQILGECGQGTLQYRLKPKKTLLTNECFAKLIKA